MVEMNTGVLVTQALRRALETMAFMGVVEDDVAAAERVPEEFLAAAVDFSGPACGTCRVALPKALGRTLVQNVLLEGPRDEGQVADAVQELANVVCGLLLPMLAVADEPTFEVTVSRREDCRDRAVWDRLARGEDTQWARVDGWPVAVQCIVQGQGG